MKKTRTKKISFPRINLLQADHDTEGLISHCFIHGIVLYEKIEKRLIEISASSTISLEMHKALLDERNRLFSILESCVLLLSAITEDMTTYMKYDDLKEMCETVGRMRDLFKGMQKDKIKCYCRHCSADPESRYFPSLQVDAK